MLSVGAIVLLLSVVAGLVLSILAWGFLRLQWRKGRNGWIGPGDEALLLGLLAVAAFAFGAFVTYALLGLRL